MMWCALCKDNFKNIVNSLPLDSGSLSLIISLGVLSMANRFFS